MFERFSKAARASVVQAQDEARVLGSGQIGSVHLLLGVLADAHSLASRVMSTYEIDHARVRSEVESLGQSDAAALDAIGIDLDAIRRRAEESFGRGALDRTLPESTGRFGRRRRTSHLPFDPSARKSLELALREAVAMKHNYIGTEHVLLGLVRDEKAQSMRVLRRLGLRGNVATIRGSIIDEIGGAA